jgi:hypothetical protein
MKSRYKGVYWNQKSRKWQARISVRNRLRELGLYEAEVNAAKAYNLAARRFRGRSAKLNLV